MYTRDTVHMKVIHTRKDERERKKHRERLPQILKKINRLTYKPINKMDLEHNAI